MAKRKAKITDPRIGIGEQYPDVSLGGNGYDKTQSTIRIDPIHFVVLDRFMQPVERDALLDDIRAIIAGQVVEDNTDEPA